MDKLCDASLFRQQCLVAGKWGDATDSGIAEVINPADNTALGTVPFCGRGEAEEAVEAAHEAQKEWKTRTANERSVVVRRWAELVEENLDDLARIMTLEQGKIQADARGELSGTIKYLQWFAEQAKRVDGDIIPTRQNDRRVMVFKEPVGVCGAITPWNYPSSMIARKAGPALAVGCSMVVKPALETPYSALALAVLAERAGMPAGLFSVVTGDEVEIGKVLTQHPLVRKISFTGSTAVGKILLAQAASTVKKVSMELGGNAPFILCSDGDVDAAVAGAVKGKFRNAGQTCVAPNRFYVHESVYNEFCTKFAEAVSRLRVGNGFDENADLGPLIGPAAVEKVQRHIQDALDCGATILTGGKVHELGGNFFEPTVVEGCTACTLPEVEETFGPLAPIFKVESDEEALELANRSDFGLASYVFTRDISKIFQFADGLESGLVGINAGVITAEMAPFGGYKQSGLGREGSKYGVDDYLQKKYVCLAGV